VFAERDLRLDSFEHIICGPKLNDIGSHQMRFKNGNLKQARSQFSADRTLVTVELLSWLSSVRLLSVRHGCTMAKRCKIRPTLLL